MTDPAIIASALGLSPEEQASAQKEQDDFYAGRDAHAMQIAESAAMVPVDPYARPKRVKKPLKDGERRWTEKEFMAAFEDYAMRTGTSSAVFEGKATPDTSLPFDRLEPHQKAILLKSKHDKTYYHPSDYGNAMGFKKKLPCDAFFVVKVKAFVVVMFRVREKANKTFYLVDIDAWCEEEAKSERKSLTEERANVIGTKCSL